jgi:hypothetical protein
VSFAPTLFYIVMGQTSKWSNFLELYAE